MKRLLCKFFVPKEMSFRRKRLFKTTSVHLEYPFDITTIHSISMNCFTGNIPQTLTTVPDTTESGVVNNMCEYVLRK